MATAARVAIDRCIYAVIQAGFEGDHGDYEYQCWVRVRRGGVWQWERWG